MDTREEGELDWEGARSGAKGQFGCSLRPERRIRNISTVERKERKALILNEKDRERCIERFFDAFRAPESSHSIGHHGHSVTCLVVYTQKKKMIGNVEVV